MNLRLSTSLLICFALVACSAGPMVVKDQAAAEIAYHKRSAGLRQLTEWDLAGKLSLDDTEDGGSGRLTWKVRELESSLRFRGALGKGAWTLSSGTDYAELQRSDGSISRTRSVTELVEAELGWYLPVESLKWWALGVAAPGRPELLDLDEQGRIVAMQQDGWNIHFEKYRLFDGIELPARMDAVRGRYRVKLAVSNWTLHEAGPTDE